jgi:hypothetical protein
VSQDESSRNWEVLGLNFTEEMPSSGGWFNLNSLEPVICTTDRSQGPRGTQGRAIWGTGRTSPGRGRRLGACHGRNSPPPTSSPSPPRPNRPADTAEPQLQSPARPAPGPASSPPPGPMAPNRLKGKAMEAKRTPLPMAPRESAPAPPRLTPVPWAPLRSKVSTARRRRRRLFGSLHASTTGRGGGEEAPAQAYHWLISNANGSL